jgi:hypothetical protein
MSPERNHQSNQRFTTKGLDRYRNQGHIWQDNLPQIKRSDDSVSDSDLLYSSEIYLISIDFYDISELKFFGIQHHNSSDHIPQDFFESQSHSERYSSQDKSYIKSHDFKSHKE